MKKARIFFVMITILTSNLAKAQKEDLFVIGKYFIFTENLEILEVEGDVSDYSNLKNGKSISSIKGIEFKVKGNSLLSVKNGWTFKVLKRDENLYIIKFISIDTLNNKFFAISHFELINYTKLYDGNKPKNGFVSSAITIPIKVRFGSKNNEALADGELERLFNFEANYNLGITAGWRNRFKNSNNTYLSYLAGFNIGTTKITSETASVSQDSNTSIFTPFFGLLFEYNNFQIGIFTGWDHVGGKLSKSWVYQGKTWLGFGFGYNLFTSKDNASSK